GGPPRPLSTSIRSRAAYLRQKLMHDIETNPG
nr:2A [Human cosavirus B]